MAKFDYARSRASADRLIKRFGQPGAIRRTATTGGDPWNPDGGSTTTTDHPCTLVVMDYSERERDGSLIQAGDRKALVSADGIAIKPSVADKAVIQGVAHEIANVTPLNPGGTVLLYELQVRS